MRYIEPHAHMVSRTTADYQAMAIAGCAAICEPAFWAGYDRASAVAKEALASGRPVREIVLEAGDLSAEELDRLLSPEAMTKPKALS